LSAKYRVFSPEFKKRVAQRIVSGESVSSLCQELDIKRAVLYRWRDTYRKEGRAGFERPVGRPPGRAAPGPRAAPEAAQRRIAELERKIGQQTLDLDFLRRAFKRLKESRRNNTGTGATASTPRSEV
jgi:transposase-like protein